MADHGASPGSATRSRPTKVDDGADLPKCSSAFDALYFCMTPGNQFKKYYREGTYDDCDSSQQMFFLCMRLRYFEVNGKGDTVEAQAVRQQMRGLSTKSTDKHVWKLRTFPPGSKEEAAAASQVPGAAKEGLFSSWFGGGGGKKAA